MRVQPLLVPGGCCGRDSVLPAQQHVPVPDEPTHWLTYFELTELVSYFMLLQGKLFWGGVGMSSFTRTGQMIADTQTTRLSFEAGLACVSTIPLLTQC